MDARMGYRILTPAVRSIPFAGSFLYHLLLPFVQMTFPLVISRKGFLSPRYLMYYLAIWSFM